MWTARTAKFRGSATKEIHPTSTPEEMEKEIRSALFAAKFVKNPWYPVVSGTKAGEAETEAGDMDEELVRIIKTLQAVRTESDEKVNSYEIFVNRKKTHIRNSKGVDVSFSSGDDETELVINVKKRRPRDRAFKGDHLLRRKCRPDHRGGRKTFRQRP